MLKVHPVKWPKLIAFGDVFGSVIYLPAPTSRALFLRLALRVLPVTYCSKQLHN